MLYNINFTSGRLEPIETENKNNLPIGQILQLNGYDNPQYVITENLGISKTFPSHGSSYRVINLDTLIPAQKNAYELLFIEEKTSNRIQTYILNIVLTFPEVEKIKEKSVIAISEAARQKREAQEKREKEIAGLPAKFPYLIPGDNPTKNIRIELKREFPKTKFSVTTTRGTGSIRINWTDGPTVEKVVKITGKYQEGNFNGMEDIYEYDHDNLFAVVFGGAQYVFENRAESRELIIETAKKMGLELETDCFDNYGNLTGLDYGKSQMVYREARKGEVSHE